MLWELNRFRIGSHCKKRSCAKTPLLMLIDILLPSSRVVILTPDGQSVKTTVRKQFRRLRPKHAAASAARAASFKSRCGKLEAPLALAADSGRMTGNSEVIVIGDSGVPNRPCSLRVPTTMSRSNRLRRDQMVVGPETEARSSARLNVQNTFRGRWRLNRHSQLDEPCVPRQIARGVAVLLWHPTPQ